MEENDPTVVEPKIDPTDTVSPVAMPSGEIVETGVQVPEQQPRVEEVSNTKSFRLTTNKRRARLTRFWPIIESSLKQLHCSCEMSTDDHTVSVVSPGPVEMKKARYLFKLLFKTAVPAPLAIELALEGRQHHLIHLGTHNKAGLFKKFGLDKEKVVKLQRRLKRSLMELGDLTCSVLYLNKTNLVAVGTSPRLRWVRKVLELCIKQQLSPLHVIQVFNQKLKLKLKREKPKFDPAVSNHFHKNRNIKYYRLTTDTNREKLREAWPIVNLSLEKLGFSCEISLVDSTVSLTPWTSAHPDILCKADYLFKLLLNTTVPASVAIELAVDGKQHDLVKFGTKVGGICKTYGIKKEKFGELQRGLKDSLKELADLTHCQLYLSKGRLVTVGPSPRLHWVRKVLELCVIDKLSPAHVIGLLSQNPEQITMVMESSDTTMIENSGLDVREKYSLTDIPKMEKSGFGLLKRVTDPTLLMQDRPLVPVSRKNREKLREAMPLIKSSLEELGHKCTTRMADSTASLVLHTTTDPDIKRKTDHLFKLLLETPVPAELAVKLALSGKHHDLIKLTPKAGMCLKKGIKKDHVIKMRRLLLHSLKELTDLTSCRLYLRKDTLTAVGSSSRLGWVREIVEYCLINRLRPRDVISSIKGKLEKGASSLVTDVNRTMKKDGAAEESFSFGTRRATMMEDAMAMVQPCLEKYDISYTLDMNKRTVTISTTGASEKYPDAFEKARHLLQLVTTRDVPPPLAIKVALNDMPQEFIEIGFQKGGLCSIHGIKKEQYIKRRASFVNSRKLIKEYTKCDRIYCLGQTITALSPSSVRLGLFRKIVLRCIVENKEPADIISGFESKRKVRRSINRLLEEYQPFA